MQQKKEAVAPDVLFYRGKKIWMTENGHQK
jgi:hypothetical protein